jgi:hypothetical protein
MQLLIICCSRLARVVGRRRNEVAHHTAMAVDALSLVRWRFCGNWLVHHANGTAWARYNSPQVGGSCARSHLTSDPISVLLGTNGPSRPNVLVRGSGRSEGIFPIRVGFVVLFRHVLAD